MNYYGGKELAAAFRTVRNNTIQVAQDIPENKYDFKASPESRTVAQTLAHIACGTNFAQSLHGERIDNLGKLNFPEIMQKNAADEAKLRSKSEILAALKANGEKFAAFLETLPESVLQERVAMPPGADPASKTRFEMLLSPKEHEMHHRGQLMTIQRIVGVMPHLTRQRQEQMARHMAGNGQQTAPAAR
ncbi:MAG: DinB family protein [Acidobacteriota bacterium]|nr:DinB family protein [Acidobacteriota bacterium]